MSVFCGVGILRVNPLMPGGNKKVTHTFNKPAAETCRFV